MHVHAHMAHRVQREAQLEGINNWFVLAQNGAGDDEEESMVIAG